MNQISIASLYRASTLQIGKHLPCNITLLLITRHPHLVTLNTNTQDSAELTPLCQPVNIIKTRGYNQRLLAFSH